MNAEKLTQKSAEAIRTSQALAQEYGNPQIEQIHLLCALLTVAHMLYAIDAYSRTSIIYFIAKELW